MTLYCVTGASTDDEGLLFEAACAQAGVDFVAVDPAAFDFTTTPMLDDGDALLRLSPGAHEARVERRLFRPGLRTLYRTPLGPFQVTNDPAFHLRRAGLPIPMPWPVTQHSQEVLANAARRLGGFPVLVSSHGACFGTGVLVAWNDADLLGIVRHLAVDGSPCVLFPLPPPGELWRVSVLDDALLVAAHGPWETHPATRPFFDAASSYKLQAPADVLALAGRAVAAMGLRAGTVDVLVPEDQPALLLDVCFPLDLLVAQELMGVDFVGRVVKELVSG